MSELGVNSLNITESNATLESSDIRTLKVFFGKRSDEDEDILGDASPLKPATATIKKHIRPFLISQSTAMAKNLHILLSNIEKLPNNPPMMNPLKFESAESYSQFLLEKIKKNTKKELETEIENDI